MRHRLFLSLAAASLLAASLAPAADPTSPASGDRILTFGGGPMPQHSQASLEQNVLYFRRVLKDLNLASLRHDVYFTDGSSTSRTVEVKTHALAATDLRPTLAAIYGDNPDTVAAQFRPAQIPEVAGPSTPDAIAKWFDDAGKSMRPKDHLLVYFTGHGGPLLPMTGRRNPMPTGPGTLLDTWNRTAITTKDFTADLDKLDPNVNVTLVMVQCFSGGFANVIYNGGDPAKGLSPAHRCGFFSTTSTRPAAGCTMDIDGDDYQEFSTFFFAALSGKTRAGKPVDRPDYDHDGVTSFTEAFTYVLLNSNTIDIPVTTSDQFLRDKSRFASFRQTDAKLLSRDASYAALLAAASPSQKAALDGLSTILTLTGDNRISAARVLAITIERDRADLQRTMRDAEIDYNRLSLQIRPTLDARWPELAVRFHPDADAVLTKDAKEIQAAIESHPAYAAWKTARDKWLAAWDKDNQLERKWVKVQRFLTRAESVILAANLERAAPAETVQAYKSLIALENQSLTTWTAH